MESVDRTSINLSEKYWRTVDWMRMWQLLFTRCPNGYATIKAIKNFSCKNWFVQGIFYIIWDNWLDCAVSTLNKSYDSGEYGRHRIASNRMFNQYRYHLIKWNLSWNVCFDRIECACCIFHISLVLGGTNRCRLWPMAIISFVSLLNINGLLLKQAKMELSIIFEIIDRQDR